MYLNFSIRNFWKVNKKFNSYFYFRKKLSKYKEFEMQCVTDGWHVFCVEFKIGVKEDHAGIRLAVSLFGIEVYLQLIDIRHWDHINDRWESNSASEMVRNGYDGF